jgi:hypothetical protein
MGCGSWLPCCSRSASSRLTDCIPNAQSVTTNYSIGVGDRRLCPSKQSANEQPGESLAVLRMGLRNVARSGRMKPDWARDTQSNEGLRLRAASLFQPAWLSISKPSCRWHHSAISSLGTHRFCDTFHAPTGRFAKHSGITNLPMSYALSLALLKDQDS